MKMLNALMFLLTLFACDSGNDSPTAITNGFADVIKVEASGNTGSYRFTVTISSPDTGCDQYADWWEVLSENGELIHRRILLHSHIDEQPFTRTGIGIEISDKQLVYIRAHMNNSGYGGAVMKGTVSDGFQTTEVAENFAAQVEAEEPQPERCAF